MQGDYGAGLSQTAQNTGQSAISNFNPSDIAGTQRSGLFSPSGMVGQTMGAGGPLTSQDYFNRYTQAVASNPTVTGLYNTANKMFNVPSLANQAAYLQNQVTNVTPQQYQLAKGFDVSEPQVQNAINTNLRFLQPQATAATNQAQTAQQLANQYVQAGISQNQFNLLPIQQQGDVLTQALASAQTGWNQANANELSALQAKMNAGITLSQAEMDRANVLAQQQTAYQQTLLGIQYQNVGAGNNLVNTFTGQIINPGILTQKTGTYNLG